MLALPLSVQWQIKSTKGFETVVSREPEKKLAELLAKGEVEGIVR
jgi:hypothetical protein